MSRPLPLTRDVLTDSMTSSGSTVASFNAPSLAECANICQNSGIDSCKSYAALLSHGNVHCRLYNEMQSGNSHLNQLQLVSTFYPGIAASQSIHATLQRNLLT